MLWIRIWIRTDFGQLDSVQDPVGKNDKRKESEGMYVSDWNAISVLDPEIRNRIWIRIWVRFHIDLKCWIRIRKETNDGQQQCSFLTDIYCLYMYRNTVFLNLVKYSLSNDLNWYRILFWLL